MGINNVPLILMEINSKSTNLACLMGIIACQGGAGTLKINGTLLIPIPH